MNLKNLGLGLFGQVFQSKIMKKKEPSLFIKEKPLADIKYLGVGFFEWVAVLSVFCVILGAILKNF